MSAADRGEAPPDAPPSPDALGWIATLPTRGLLDTLDITIVAAEPERVVMTMPVTPRVHQPMGLLHGGASVALAESAASMAGALNVDRTRHVCVGVEINANHVRSLREGTVTATATPLHRGRSTQVWEIRITDEAARLVCISRCTLAVVPRTHGH